ncbi:MAG: phage protease [Thiobacillus sp.]|jgi:phage I-like protein|uniref:phage protease n=1 Tax=Thiobacillus sp. TaxID=924 RepID=UPI002895D871|nr:phage protease [Thiobacillus sp.]MDT3707472.1 phage protease [Thiobacillus sp.]
MPTAFAALSIAITPASGREIQLTPAGLFKARDGRPAGIAGWKLDAQTALKVAARAAARKTPFVIDYEHQTLATEKNGQPAPAAGWFKTLEWRDGAGLFATDVEWTAKAKAHIEAGEYKFISPVFGYDPKTGDVLQVEMAALTNTPALDGMDAVAALAQDFFNRSQEPTHEKDRPMKALANLLGLAEDATEADISAAIVALKAKTTEHETTIAALKTQAPDPAKFVPVETVTALQGQVAALTTRLNDTELEDVVQAALSSGKLLPAMEGWARDLGKKDIAALKGYIEKNPAIAALNGNQTGGKGPEGRTDGELSATDLAICKSMGIKPEDYKATLAEQAAA